MRKTKIVATLGPATSSKEVLSQLFDLDLNVCRFNFSHGDHEFHKNNYEIVKQLNVEKKMYVSTLADLQGPKIRVGEMMENTELIVGKKIDITTNKIKIGNDKKIYVSYTNFASDVKKGERILLDDGNIELEVESTNKLDNVTCIVVRGGILLSRKGVNLPNTNVSLPCLTDKDLKDLDFILENDFDWVALSFVRSARDIIELKHIISNKNKSTKIIAKIEKPEAVENLDEILKYTDGVMVARGDLGVEIPMEKVPMIQKKIVKLCIKHAKPVIIATQMMESMKVNSVPTRAEVNDVANAVIDGADAVMLSAETASGNYPVEVVMAVDKICNEVDEFSFKLKLKGKSNNEKSFERLITDQICYTACDTADLLKAKAIITMTYSGYTAYKISSYRPNSLICVFSSNRDLLSRLSVVWGVKCYFYDKKVSTDHNIEDVAYILENDGVIKNGDYYINTASIPLFKSGTTNMLKISRCETDL